MTKACKGITLTIGESLSPIIYSLRHYQAEYAVFICTDESRHMLDQVLEEYPIPPSKYKVFEVQDDPGQIGRLIHSYYSAFRWLRDYVGLASEEIVTDPTPGRKWMSTGATMIASYLGLNITYVDVKYKQGRPDPTTMKVIPLGNAYDQTGFLETEKAREYFNKSEFKLAWDILKQITPSTSPLKDLYEGLTKIIEAFYKWDLFTHYKEDISKDFSEGRECLERYLHTEKEKGGLNDFLEKVKQKEQLAKALLESARPNLEQVIDLLLNADRRISQGKYDDATARLYRTLELIEQYYLKDIIGNTSKPSYKKLDNALRQRFREIKVQLPSKIALEDGYLLLKLLKHQAGEEVILKIKDKKVINRFGDVTKARNDSILAHGFEPISEKDAKRFSAKVQDLLRKLIGGKFEKLRRNLAFPEFPALFTK